MLRRQEYVQVSLAVAVSAVTGAIGAAIGAAPEVIAAAIFALGFGAVLAVGRAIGAEKKAAPLAPPHPAETVRAGHGAELLAALPLPLIILDRQMRVRFANSASAEIFGPVRAGEPLSSLIRASALTDAAAAVADGNEARAVEFTHMQTREERVLMAHLRPVAGGATEDGVAVMILVEDHTRLARIERMRRDFIANASHELKTPLASVSGFIETLRGPAADDPKALKRFLPIMAAQAERMKRLVEDLTSLSRIEMNEHVRPRATVDLGALVNETVVAMGPLAEAAGVSVEVDLPVRGPHVTGERDELGQLFTNLIDNAIKYGAAQGLVTVRLVPEELGRHAMVGVSVVDRGAGIAREHIPRLTERFYRVQGGGRGKEGTGLGLSIVKHILNRHRGDLTIRSAPGEGATFTAWLPRAMTTVVDDGADFPSEEEISP